MPPLSRSLAAEAGATALPLRHTLRVNTNKYKLTAALMSDVLQSQATLAEANHQYQQALLGYWTAKAEFEKALGEEK